MKYFLSCDWGTSAFRLRFVNVQGLSFESVDSSDSGVASIYETWKQSEQPESARFVFYRNVMEEFIRALEYRLGISMNGVPLVISGMASSSIGMMELPYKPLPFKIDGTDLEIMRIAPTNDFDHEILLISGARTVKDIMRGEETQLIGCGKVDDEKRIFVIPGTHSKHILVKDKRAVKLQTFMTGEFFELLNRKSILKHSVQTGSDFFNTANRKSFVEGVKQAVKGNLLHSSFLVRTRDLLNKISKENNYYFLSGLLIGTELSVLLKKKGIPVTWVASGEKAKLYVAAFKTLFPGYKQRNIRIIDPAVAVVKGQLKIWKRSNKVAVSKK
jgi:2-dehydro-3-deoxygalactonokinase